MNSRTRFSYESPSAGRRQYNGIYNINTSVLHVKC